MPRLPEINLPLFRDLLAQQRFSPHAAIIRQIERIEALAAETDPKEDYPADYLVFRITGYRPDLTTQAPINGRQALQNLSTLAERLAHLASLQPHDLPPDSLTTAQLAEHAGVSKRTIDRWRRQGLIARRVTTRTGAALYFTPAAYETFTKRPAHDKSTPDNKPRRLTPEERDRIRSLASRILEREPNASIAALARRIAPDLGRSAGAVRRVLERTPPPAAPGPRWQKTPDRDRRLAARALAWGATPAAISKRLGRSRATINRLALAERLAAVTRTLPPPPPNPSPPASLDREPPRPAPPTHPADARDWVAIARQTPPMPHHTEQDLVAAHNAAIDAARRFTDSADHNAPHAAAVDAAETECRRALRLRETLLAAQRPTLLRTIESWLGTPILDQPPNHIAALVAAANLATARVLDAQPHLSTGRLAPRLSVAVTRSLAANLSKTPVNRAKAERAAPRVTLPDPRPALAPFAPVVLTHPALARAAAGLDPTDHAAILTRFGLGEQTLDQHWPRTVAETAAALRIPPARVTAAQRRARRNIVNNALSHSARW